MEIASLITGPVGVNTYIVYGKNKGGDQASPTLNFFI